MRRWAQMKRYAMIADKVINICDHLFLLICDHLRPYPKFGFLPLLAFLERQFSFPLLLRLLIASYSFHSIIFVSRLERPS